MKRLLPILAFLLFFSTISFASQLWKIPTSGPVIGKPIVFGNGVAVVNYAGEVFLLNPLTGDVVWRTVVNGTPLQPAISQNRLIVATTNGKVALLGVSGTAEKNLDLRALQNVTYVYGVDGSATRIYLTTDRGVISIGPSGDASLIYKSSDLAAAPPAATGNAVIFGDSTDLVRITESGTLEWRRYVGGIWRTRPVVDGQVVYVGGLDNRMHALTLAGGINKWQTETGNWVLSTPLVMNGVVYFGSNDGNVYALDQTDGSVIWKTQTPQAIESMPEPGQMGGKQAVFVGSTANSIYAMSVADGTIIWKGSADGWVGSPQFYQNVVIFGSADGNVYSYSTERACSITAPIDGSTVGSKEVRVAGSAVSRTGAPKVSVRVNEGEWQQADTVGETWEFYLNPSSTMSAGLNEISCRVSDSAGTESSSVYTQIGVTRDPNIPLSDLVISFVGTGAENEPISILANDAQDGSPIIRFKASVDGTEYDSVGDSVNVTLAAGSHTVSVSKIGYKDAEKTLDIYSKGLSPLVIGAGALVLLIVLWLVFTRVFKR